MVQTSLRKAVLNLLVSRCTHLLICREGHNKNCWLNSCRAKETGGAPCSNFSKHSMRFASSGSLTLIGRCARMPRQYARVCAHRECDASLLIKYFPYPTKYAFRSRYLRKMSNCSSLYIALLSLSRIGKSVWVCKRFFAGVLFQLLPRESSFQIHTVSIGLVIIPSFI